MGFARVDLVSSETGESNRHRTVFADMQGPPLLPNRVGARVGLIDWLDVAADYGWWDAGYEVRAGLPEGSALPFAITYGRRGGGVFRAENRWHHDQRLRLELYPLLSKGELVRWHGALAVGASWGAQLHIVRLPRMYDDQQTREFAPPGLQVMLAREERRLEAAIGAECRREFGVARVSFMPYWVIDAERPHRVECNQCDHQWSAREFRQQFGFALVLSGALSFTFHRMTGNE